MAMILRPYQTDCVEAIIAALNAGERAIVACVPTGGGKSAILSALAKRFADKNNASAVLTHSRELIRQLEGTATQFMAQDQIGVTAAGLGRKDPQRLLQIAQIQTVGRYPRQLGPRRIAIIDEAQSVNHEEGQYKKTIGVLREMVPDCRLVGLTATPWRTTSGLIYGEERLFDKLVYRTGMRELIDGGYLCPLIGKAAERDFKMEGVSFRGGDFKPEELEAFMADEAKVERAISDALIHTANRNKILCFSCGLKHSAMIVAALRKHGQTAESIDGTMGTAQRDKILTDYHDQRFRWLVNTSILTTGYDETGIDCIVLLRPTRSPGLLMQMAGRGLRKDPAKADCLFLDYGGSLAFFGPLDCIEETIVLKKRGPPGAAPTKICDCGTVLHASALKCPTCGKEFPRELNHEVKAATGPVMSNEPYAVAVASMRAVCHTKPNKPKTIRLDYIDDKFFPIASEWMSVSAESNVYAVNKSLKVLADWPDSPFKHVGDFLFLRGQTKPLAFDEILAHCTTLKPPTSVTLRRDGKHTTVTKRDYA